jgi:hypothetical protein
MAEGGAESQLTSSTGWHAEVRVDRRMPPIGVQVREPEQVRAGGGRRPGGDPGSPGRPARASGYPRRPSGLPLTWSQAMGHDLCRHRPVGSVWPRPNALTALRASDNVTHPPDRSSLVRPASEGDSSAEQSVRNSPSGHPAPTPAVSVCARSLLENGIVRAKSQCGQFIRSGSPDVEWVVRQFSKTQ